GSTTQDLSPSLEFERPAQDTLLVYLAGEWKIGQKVPPLSKLTDTLDSDPSIRQICFDTTAITQWDSILMIFLTKVIRHSSGMNLSINQDGLHKGMKNLLKLSSSVPNRIDATPQQQSSSLLTSIGKRTLQIKNETLRTLSFLGQSYLMLVTFLKGNARYQRSNVMLMIKECGPSALPIVSLISLLVGMILAFVGAVQLEMFGAQIYIASLVGLGMAREMGAMMTGIIMAGRTGAAFAAQLGSMQVNEEIDAFRTMGIPPMEFLVLPRMLALIVMMPLLCLYADFLGIVGGFVVASTLFDISLFEYYQQTIALLSVDDFAGGLFKSIIFGILIALSGCMRGIQSGRSASAVGEAATSAVVTAIVWIVVSDAILTVIYNALGV
ncbi:MAG: ABC transporter permease, partial [Methylococcales bacterium]